MRARNRKRRFIGSGLALTLLIVVAAASFLGWQQYMRSADATRRIVAKIRLLDGITDLVDEAQVAQQEYLLTHLRTYRDSFRALYPTAIPLLSRLSSDDRQSAAAVLQFKDAVTKKLTELKQAIEPIQGGAVGTDSLVLNVSVSHDLVTNVHLMAHNLESNLQRSLDVARTTSRLYARLSQFIVTVGCIGIFVILLISHLRISRLISTTSTLNTRLATANQDLQQFIFSASHDLQEPLRTLCAFVDRIGHKLKFGQPVEIEFRHLRIAADRMMALISDLLNYTEITNDERSHLPQQSDLQKIALEVISSLNALITQTGASIKVQQLPLLPISHAHARLVLHNLLSNALKYRSPGVAPLVVLSAQAFPREWIVAVEDNGIGIQSQYHQHVFGIFKRLHTRSEYSGTGLGLALCKKIVERYDGRIWLESQPGVGSIFSFSVPRRD